MLNNLPLLYSSLIRISMVKPHNFQKYITNFCHTYVSDPLNLLHFFIVLAKGDIMLEVGKVWSLTCKQQQVSTAILWYLF